MKKSFAVTLTLTLFFLFVPQKEKVFSKELKQARPQYVGNQVVVKLKAGIDARIDIDIPSFVAEARGSKVKVIDPSDEESEFVVELDGSISVEEAVAQLNSDPRVEFAEPNYLLHAANMPNDSRFNEQWPLLNSGVVGKAGADIGATRAWNLTTGSSDVVVAVIDTGIDLQHPDLAPNAWVNTREIPGNGIDDDGNGFADDVNGWDFVNDRGTTFESAAIDWHGTHVAGIIGAAGNNGIGTAGVAWNVKLMSLKFLGGRSGTSEDAIRAINYAIDQRRRGVNVQVINASWSGPEGSRALLRAIRKAGKEGILFVCAAGNGGDDNRGDNLDVTPEYPAVWAAQLDSVISVAAIDSSDAVPSFSNYGHETVSVAAPGLSVLSTYPGGSYTVSSGTSMATPHVSGVAALVWSYNKSLTPDLVKKRIVETAEQVLPLASKSSSPGRVNAYNAVTATIPMPSFKPAIRSVLLNGKRLIIDGLGIMQNSAFVEVNGFSLPYPRFDRSFALADGTLTQMVVKLKTSELETFFPFGTPVQVVIFNPSSGERSAAFGFTRR